MDIKKSDISGQYFFHLTFTLLVHGVLLLSPFASRVSTFSLSKRTDDWHRQITIGRLKLRWANYIMLLTHFETDSFFIWLMCFSSISEDNTICYRYVKINASCIKYMYSWLNYGHLILNMKQINLNIYFKHFNCHRSHEKTYWLLDLIN